MRSDREPIPSATCDYMIRMHLKSIESISQYMKDGCQSSGINGPQGMCVALITLKQHIDKVLDMYSNGKN